MKRWRALRLRRRAKGLRADARVHQARAHDETALAARLLDSADALHAEADRLDPPSPDTGAPEPTDRAGAPSPQS